MGKLKKFEGVILLVGRKRVQKAGEVHNILVENSSRGVWEMGVRTDKRHEKSEKRGGDRRKKREKCSWKKKCSQLEIRKGGKRVQ